MASNSSLRLSDAEYRIFCELLRGHCGLCFDESSRFMVEKRLMRRMEALELGSFSAYLYFLRNGHQGDEELAQVIDILVTNETYFFREGKQLKALIEEVIPELLMRRKQRQSGRPISIWSAGCSSGEEPYSVVALALEAGLVPGRDLHVYASDISRVMLTKSRRGVYRESAFRETSSYLRGKYFREKDGQYQICDDLRRYVDFIHINLIDRSKIALLGTMDVILCRNVIIYFDSEIKKTVIGTFYDKLCPGGYLLLGHSESLINVSSALELCHLKNDLVYRRPVPGGERMDPWHAMAEAAVSEVERGGTTR
jgi:chemotaxis protein methyltransferase CheR